MSAPIIATFSGLSLDFPQWRNSLLDVAATSSNLCPYGKGLQGHLVPEIEWIALLTHDGVLNPGPHVALPAPDAQPVLQASPTTAQISAYNSLWNAWSYANTEYRSEAKFLMDFKVAMLEALDKTTLMRISNPIIATRHLTCGAILRDMKATVGTFSPSDLAANEAKLRDPYNPTDNINDFLSTHIGAHATAAANL